MAGGRGRAWRRGKTFAFDAQQQVLFVAAVERGATIAAAAREAKAAVATVYYRRKTCPLFARAWAGAVAKSSGYADLDPPGAATVIRGHAGRLIRKRKRPVEFDRERRQAFLDHFAGSCNLEASAKAAGVCVNTVYRALASDPAFADGFEEALRIGYRLLEAEALRQQRAAQRKYRISPKGDPGAQAQSFERTMQLLREYNRGQGKVGRRAARRGDPRSRWTFDEAMEALEKKLKHFGVEIVEEAPPPLSERSPSPPNGEEE